MILLSKEEKVTEHLLGQNDIPPLLLVYCRTCAGPPSNVDIAGRTGTSLIVSWEDNMRRGNPEEVYDIRCVTPGSPCLSTPALTGGPFQREYPFRNLGAITLVPGDVYDCYIVAINPTGLVCSSDFLSRVTL